MTVNDSNPDKTSGHDPAAIELDDGTTIDAAHSYRNGRDTLLFLCVEGRSGGADVVVPLESDKPAYAKSELGEDVLDIDTDADDVESGDDPTVVADGGRDVPSCECGADLVRTAELTTAKAPDAGARGPCPPMRTVPDAECSNCGASVGAMYGTAAAITVWEARGESLLGDDSDDGESRLMTDGGIGRRQPGAHEGRPVVPDNPATVVDFDVVDRGDRVTSVDGTVVGHVIETRVAEMHQRPDQNVIEYVTADGAGTRAEVFETRQIPVCDACGDIVVQDGGGVASSHDDDGCNGGD